MPKKLAAQVARLSRQLPGLRSSGIPVRIYRDSIERYGNNGIVVASNKWFCAIQWITGEIHLDGFQILRTCDISGIEVLERRARYLRKVLALRGERVSRPGRVDLEDWPAILRWAGSRFPLLVVHRELTDPNVCHVGQVISASEVTLTMLTIDECGRWDPKPWQCRMRTITRLDFGGGYESALALASGTEPNWRPSKQPRRSKS